MSDKDVQENLGILEELLGDEAGEVYIFVLDAVGNLRSMMVPESYTNIDAPESVSQIMEMFNIKNSVRPTLH